MAANRSNNPKHELEVLARHFLPQIQAFFESEEGRKEYEDWKAARDKIEKKKADKKAWKTLKAENWNSLPVFKNYKR